MQRFMKPPQKLESWWPGGTEKKNKFTKKMDDFLGVLMDLFMDFVKVNKSVSHQNG